MVPDAMLGIDPQPVLYASATRRLHKQINAERYIRAAIAMVANDEESFIPADVIAADVIGVLIACAAVRFHALKRHCVLICLGAAALKP